MTTLNNIRRTIRNITGRKDVNQLSDARIDDYINDFYLYDFPERLKTLEMEGFYESTTIPNVAEYTLPQDYYLVKAPAYVAGYQVGWHQSPDVFYSIWPDLRFLEQVSTGTGGINYTFTLTNTTILQQSVLISAGNEVFTDYRNITGYPNGQLLSNMGGTGTIDYSTGIATVTFGLAVAVGEPIIAQYYRYVASRPRDILFYPYNYKIYDAPNYTENSVLSFVFRPVPNHAYMFRMLALRRPTAMPAANSSPEFVEWCNLIAYGAALKIFIEDADWEEYRNMYPIFQEQKNLAQRRALKQLATQRAHTQYSFAMDGTRSMWPLYPIY